MTARVELRSLLVGGMVWGSAGLVTLAFGALMFDVAWQGLGQLSWSFLSELPVDSGRAGGILSILVSTGLILVVCLAATVPLGLLTAIYLSEISRGHSLAGKLVRRSLDVLGAVPSIVFGLFGNVVFCHLLGLGFSIASGGLTLACMVLPTFIRTVELGLRSVPDELRQGAAALALSRVTTLRRVLLPRAGPAITAGLVLGVGRALAETAALVFTSGYVDRMPGSLLDSGRAVSVHIYDLAMNVPGGNRAAYGTALVLVLALVLIQQLSSRLVRRVIEGRIV